MLYIYILNSSTKEAETQLLYDVDEAMNAARARPSPKPSPSPVSTPRLRPGKRSGSDTLTPPPVSGPNNHRKCKKVGV